MSREMFEAVGLASVHEQRFDAHRRNPDWIQTVIFPGGEVASLRHVLQSLERATALSLHHCEEIGMHYALTLREWRRRFLANLPAVFRLGFDERFARVWEYYLASCEGAFLERHTGTAQILLTKNHSSRRLFGEPLAADERSLHNEESCPKPLSR